MSSKEIAEKKQKNNGMDRDTTMNGVLITVYVESSTPRSRKLSNIMTKTKANQIWEMMKSARKLGYDRRAQLLAYSRQLRNASSQEADDNVQLLTNESRPKTKHRCIWLTQPVRICSRSSQLLLHSNCRKKCEQRVALKEIKQVNHQSSKKGSEGDKSSVLRKVKNMLRVMSCKQIKQ